MVELGEPKIGESRWKAYYLKSEVKTTRMKWTWEVNEWKADNAGKQA